MMVMSTMLGLGMHLIIREIGTLPQYLEKDSLMQNAYKVVKEARDWLPLI